MDDLPNFGMPTLRTLRTSGATPPRWALVSLICVINSATAQTHRTPLYELPDPASSPQSEVGQGFSVAIEGTLAAVSTPSDHTEASQAGVVKIYDAMTGALRHTLVNPTPAIYDRFGNSVAFSGSRLVVGAIYDDTGAEDAGAAYVYDLSGPTPTTPQLTLTNPAPAKNAYFGRAVAISGSQIVVGAPQGESGGNAYVFDLSSLSPTVPIVTLTNPGSMWFYSSFGTSVAVSDQRVAVGAPENGTGGPGTGGRSTGFIYIYNLNGTDPTVPVVLNNPAPDEFDGFGFSIAMSGGRLVVGAPDDDAGGLNTGRAYVYNLTVPNPATSVLSLNNPSPGTDDHFGYSVAISGTRAVVGAYWDDSGANETGRAYVYDLARPNAAVPSVTLNNPTPAQDDRFAWSVAIAGTHIVVGAPFDDTATTEAGIAYTYDLTRLNPESPAAILNNPTLSSDRYGSAVALSGTRAIVGAPNSSVGSRGAGSAHLYDINGALNLLTLTNPSPKVFAAFGSAVAISGTRAVVGAYRDSTVYSEAGRAYVYDLTGMSPTVPILTLEGMMEDRNFGTSVAISSHRVVAASSQTGGLTSAGAAYVFDLNGSIPRVPVMTLSYPIVSNYFRQSFRIAVAISGTRLVVGRAWDQPNAADEGRADVYDLAGITPTNPIVTLINPSPAPRDAFGLSIAIAGSWLAVGAAGDDTGAPDAGSVYVYDLAGSNPAVPALTLTNPSPASLDNFGASVAVSDSYLAVGASNDDGNAPNAGSVYVYSVDRNKPLSTSPLYVLNKLRASTGEHFGSSVGIDGRRVLVGAPDVASPVVYRGSAYVFGLEPGLEISWITPGVVSIGWTPTNATGFVLQQNSALGPDGWLNAESGATNPTTIIATNPASFFRLFKP